MIINFASNIFKKYEGSTFDLLGKTVNDVLDKSLLELKDIDGLFLTHLSGTFDGKSNLHFMSSQISSFLGIKPKIIDTIDYGGPSALTMLYRSYKMIKSGDINNALCIVGGKGSFLRDNKVTADSIDKFYPNVSITPFDEIFRIYNDLNPVTDYALVANRHKKLFGSTDEQRALIAVKQRINAIDNKKAMYRNPLTLDDVLKSKMISEPLRLLEIVYPVDGFHVFLVSKKNGKADVRSLDILFYNEAHWPQMPTEYSDIIYTPTIESSKGVELTNIDAYELYDSFTITVLLEIEDIGLAKKGEGGKFVESHDITYQGDVPINTGGGSLNMGQPAFMSGGVILEEALLQLNSIAEGHQVKDANRILINGIGGWNRGHAVTMVLGEEK
ncbi:thiolase family protein [Acidianus manzaensis]|uniref:Acetyl-CoA acetyltransferase n=1 Tax=Acidianus manzaensis TaxID=282676 RepID=A0A1W6JYZ8_9CREN|nr:thiolase family protein [Acidianus manzaensis]ARM75541.1 acetyl-CoA acetyltransferase [Acidianus manzaensis]